MLMIVLDMMKKSVLWLKCGIIWNIVCRKEQRDAGDEPAVWWPEVAGRHGAHLRNPGLLLAYPFIP
jgi:hypothetical protein